jgi:hypothetical protein
MSSQRIGGRFAFAVATTALSLFSMPAFAEDQIMSVIAQASSGPLRCEIRKTEAGGLVELTGVIASDRALTGQFRFTILKSGGGGSSTINQANPFTLVAKTEHPVGHVKINLDRDAHIMVELMVAADDIECRANATLDATGSR